MANNTFVNIGGHKISAGKKYSTSEVKTGDVWINGKPIYRLVLQGTTPATPYTYTQWKTLSSDVDQIINMYGIIANTFVVGAMRPGSDSVAMPGYTVWPYYDYNGHIIALVSATNSANKSMFLIVEYTKTTD